MTNQTHTASGGIQEPSALQRGLGDYDRDTIAYLAAAGVGDALLERVRRFSGPARPAAPAAAGSHRVQVCDLQRGMVIADHGRDRLILRVIGIGWPVGSTCYRLEFAEGQPGIYSGTDTVAVVSWVQVDTIGPPPTQEPDDGLRTVLLKDLVVGMRVYNPEGFAPQGWYRVLGVSYAGPKDAAYDYRVTMLHLGFEETRSRSYINGHSATFRVATSRRPPGGQVDERGTVRVLGLVPGTVVRDNPYGTRIVRSVRSLGLDGPDDPYAGTITFRVEFTRGPGWIVGGRTRVPITGEIKDLEPDTRTARTVRSQALEPGQVVRVVPALSYDWRTIERIKRGRKGTTVEFTNGDTLTVNDENYSWEVAE